MSIRLISAVLTESNTLRPDYDFIVCGGGSSGSGVARRLAENPDVQVLLIEAGGSDESETVLDPAQWPLNVGSDRDWGFQAEPNPHLDGRTLSMSMGKGLGGGSSVNVMVWARGHRSDWEYFADQAGDPAWGYDSVLDIYRHIEMTQFIRDSAVTYWHQSCTAKMGRDDMSVVDASRKVYGIEGLRIADASIMPRVATGNTQAPCAIIGERAAHLIRREYGI
jgi:choline dehydrogenase-like flavoprotein